MALLAPDPICDECSQEYEGPAYYTLEEDHHPPEETTLAIEVCTGNLCPECAGPFLEPDDPDDPRRPAE